MAAYSVAVLTSTADYDLLRTGAVPTYGWSFFQALPVGVGLAGLAALAVGVVFNRFRDDIFVLVSFGFAIIAYNSFLNLRGVTRGAFGIHEVAKPQIGPWVFDEEGEFLALSLACLAVVTLVSWLIVTSSFGRRADHHPRGRAGCGGVRLPCHALQAGGVGHIPHDGRACRCAVRQLDNVRGSQLVRAAGVGAACVHSDTWRAGQHLGFAAGRACVRAA